MVENRPEGTHRPAPPLPRRAAALDLCGAAYFPGFLDPAAQAGLVEDLRRVVADAPLFSPTTRFGGKMSVRMTSAGRYGWYSDRRGYRYEALHPSGRPWPAIPERVLSVWTDLVGPARLPDCCLVNLYEGSARMGLHQDRDEVDFSCPVVSVSLGDDARFRIGGPARGGPTESVWLRSGDVLVMGGAARLARHGIDRTIFGSSTLLPAGGRINLTLRVVS